MDPKLYKAATKGDVSCLSGINGRNITEEKAMHIRHGIFLKRTQHNGNNILHLAARAGRDTFVVEALRRFPFLSYQWNSQGDTPLLVAARFGHLQVVITLAQPNNEFRMQDDMATAVQNGTNSRSSHRQLEQGTIQDNVATLENGTKSRDMTTTVENGTNSRDMATTVENGTNSRNISHRQRDMEEGRHDNQLEQALDQIETNSTDMTTALENETNSSSSRRSRDVEEGPDEHQLEEGTTQDSMATAVENRTNSRGMATALENETNLSSSRCPRDVEEGLDGHQLEEGTIQDGMATAVENGTNSKDMITALENETNLSSSRHPRDVEEGQDYHQLDVAIPSHWRVTNEQGTTITTALHEALKNGHQDVAQYLLGLKPEMAAFDNLAGESPLFLAAESHCELFMSDILLSKRPYSTKGPDGLNALHASRDCCDAIISLLIEQKPNLMRQLDDRGKAAIHHAVEAYCWVVIDRMLKAEASMALFPDAEGYTPLLRAASGGNWLFCKRILLRCPESIEARNHQGQNALHLGKGELSSIPGFGGQKIPEMWELLNVGDDEGNTPLHLAVKENQYEKALLLTSSATIDLGAVNKQGLTALDLCESDCERYSTKRQLWFHLTRHGARRGRHPNEHMLSRGGPNMFLQYPPDEDLKPYVNTTALIAILIATITFAAAFTMPGGYDTSPNNLGGPTLVKRAALRVFILSDTLAMCTSITAVSLLTRAMRVQQDALPPFMAVSWLCLNIALLSTLVAFMSGIIAVLAPKASWVAILVCIVCSIPPFLLKSGRSEMPPFGTWFIPILPRDILLRIRKLQRMKKRIREQCYVRSLIRRGSPDTTYHVSNANTIAS